MAKKHCMTTRKHPMNEFNFEGTVVKPDKNGVYKCPFNCGDKRYPQKKWKTPNGFFNHMSSCPARPSRVVEVQKKELK